jgi:hypothetical protein
MKLLNYFLFITVFITGIIQAEIIDQVYHFNINGRDWGVVGLDTGEVFVVDCISGPIEGVEKNDFSKLGNFASWVAGDEVTYKKISNMRWWAADPGFGGWGGTIFAVLNNHDRSEYVVLIDKNRDEKENLFEDKVKEVYDNKVITEGQLKFHMTKSSTWEPGDSLINFALYGLGNSEQLMAQPQVVINSTKREIETNLTTTRAFFPFENVLTYTVVKRKKVYNVIGTPKNEITLSDGTVWRESLSQKLKVGDEIVLRQFDDYRWGSFRHFPCLSLSFSAILVDTGEEIELDNFHYKENFVPSSGQSWEPIGQGSQLLIGNQTLVEVVDQESYEKVLSWDPTDIVIIALANHGDDYILLNLTSYRSTEMPMYTESFGLWVDIQLSN